MFLKTERLQLRPFQAGDAARIYSYRANPNCAKFQRWADTSLPEISRFLEKYQTCIFLSEQEEQHYGVYLSSGVLAGDLSYFFNPSDNCITLGITIAPEYQHQGIAREMLAAVIAAAQHRYPHMDLVALIDPENRSSIRLFEHLGFIQECYAESIRSYVYILEGR